ncbi:MAG TPA: hypothetical protein VFR80_16295 [Pyrinomonadaceae bacterium]|nr:hypothetical protein [Pyrinomonadaceae bacterium]
MHRTALAYNGRLRREGISYKDLGTDKPDARNLVQGQADGK